MFGLFLLTAAAVFQQEASYKPVANNAQLMRAFIIPSSDALFDVSLEAPKNGAEWTAIENHALILAESGNLMMMVPRASEGVWMKESRALVDAGAAAFKAAQAKDVERLVEIGDEILATCKGCHDKYLFK